MTNEIKDTLKKSSHDNSSDLFQTQQQCFWNVSRAYMRSLIVLIYWNHPVVFASLTVWFVQYFLFHFYSVLHTLSLDVTTCREARKCPLKTNKQTNPPFVCFNGVFIHLISMALFPAHLCCCVLCSLAFCFVCFLWNSSSSLYLFVHYLFHFLLPLRFPFLF